MTFEAWVLELLMMMGLGFLRMLGAKQDWAFWVNAKGGWDFCRVLSFYGVPSRIGLYECIECQGRMGFCKEAKFMFREYAK